MAALKDVIEGLTILAKYTNKGLDGHDVAASHDIIMAGPGDPKAVSQEDHARLEALGWHISSDSDSWARFV